MPGIVVCGDEVLQMCFELPVVVVMVSFDARFLDRSVHPFDLPVGLGMFDLGAPVFDPIFVSPHIEHVGHISCSGAVSVPWWECEQDTVI